jgi:hypothetical protein
MIIVKLIIVDRPPTMYKPIRPTIPPATATGKPIKIRIISRINPIPKKSKGSPIVLYPSLTLDPPSAYPQ